MDFIEYENFKLHINLNIGDTIRNHSYLFRRAV
jgi:hypothetical protein